MPPGPPADSAATKPVASGVGCCDNRRFAYSSTCRGVRCICARPTTRLATELTAFPPTHRYRRFPGLLSRVACVPGAGPRLGDPGWWLRAEWPRSRTHAPTTTLPREPPSRADPRKACPIHHASAFEPGVERSHREPDSYWAARLGKTTTTTHLVSFPAPLTCARPFWPHACVPWWAGVMRSGARSCSRLARFALVDVRTSFLCLSLNPELPQNGSLPAFRRSVLRQTATPKHVRSAAYVC
jgi:hypothetical protein